MTPVLLAPLALTAGVLSFTSPCSLPLLPGYVAYITAVPEEDVRAAGRSRRVTAALLFVAGFSVVFTMLGTGIALAGSTIARHMALLERIAGVVLVGAGLVTGGFLRIRAVAGDHRPGLSHAPRGVRGAFLLGAAFAAGWSPCIGPVLASVLAITAGSGAPAWGAALLLVYSAGLGIPFVALAAGADRPRWLGFLRRHSRGLERGGGIALAAIGVLMLSGAWGALLRPLERALAELEWPPL